MLITPTEITYYIYWKCLILLIAFAIKIYRNKYENHFKLEKGTPPTPGIYFVALQLGQSIGRYDFMLWSGEVWETDQQVEIIAYIDADDIKTALSLEY